MALRAAIEVGKWLQAAELLQLASVNRFWQTAADSEEVWTALVVTLCEGLLKPETLHSAATCKLLYRSLFVPAVVPILSRRTLALLDIRTKQVERHELSAQTAITKATYVIYLPDTSLFACGGDIHSEDYYSDATDWVYRIGPLTPSVEVLPSLLERRRYPGTCFYKGEVFAFGGSDRGVYKDTAECYSFQRHGWTELPKMSGLRTSCTPAIYGQEVYLAGGYPSPTLEAYHFTRKTFRVLPIPMQENVDCVAIFEGSILVTFTHREMRKIDISTEKVTEVHPISSHNYVWSHCQPKIFRGKIWFYYWHMETMVSYDLSSKQFHPIPSPKYTELN